MNDIPFGAGRGQYEPIIGKRAKEHINAQNRGEAGSLPILTLSRPGPEGLDSADLSRQTPKHQNIKTSKHPK